MGGTARSVRKRAESDFHRSGGADRFRLRARCARMKRTKREVDFPFRVGRDASLRGHAG